MPLTPGTSLGPYQIESPLGAGGMGEVYEATDTRLDRTVAIKVLPEHVAADPDLKARFEREAKTVAALSHPHICPVFDVGEQDGVNYLVVPHTNVCTIQPPAGQPRRGKRLRMCSCPRISGEVVYRSVDGRLHGPRFWWGACSTAAGPTSRC